ncbi:MAG: hemerythrin domain-containing protein [Myxococcota bacterium]|nr:hemerythrin domain-containing protein [Myxococcota bacterium]
MNANDLLTRQHREVEQLFARMEKGTGDRLELLRDLASKLAAHMRIEEEIFYPRAKELLEDKVLEGLEEHTLAAFALKRLAEVGVDHPSFEAKLKALKELVQHHVDEEESEMFPRIARAMDRQDLDEIGLELEERFEEILESGYGAELVRGAKRNGRASSRPQPRAMR